MTTDTTTPTRDAGTERGIAYSTLAAPIATGVLAPFLGPEAAIAMGGVYVGATAFLTANYMGAVPDTFLDKVPAGDVIAAHRSTMFISGISSSMALAMGTLSGSEGIDALMAGFLNPASVPGVVSLIWWGTTGLVGLKLRRILRRPRRQSPPPAAPAVPQQSAVPDYGPPVVLTGPEMVLARWAQLISSPARGTHKDQELTLRSFTQAYWEGTITAPAGKSVTVTKDVISSVYQVPTEWVGFKTGAHAGELHLMVYRAKPSILDTKTLTGAWSKWVARSGGLMEGTRLQDVQDDPATGGEVALVVAGDKLDRLRHPDLADLAGALRTKPILISYEPRSDPRQAVIRKMAHNPLQQGADFPGVDVLRPNANGYIQIGRGISGFPARLQLHDPKLGAQHVIVAGVTGSGKGGTLQILALAHHVNGSAIVYADPKGSSNPAIEHMACYSGLGLDGAMGALRIWWHGLQHRIEQSRQMGMKNFQASPQMPWAPLILDEASKLLGENAEHKKEATFIVNAGATLGRSLGMPVILANQLMQLVQLGGDAAIRDNVFYGGSLVLLRSDSQQKHMVDLPENFAGCNPADIPPAWSEDRAMVYDPTAPIADPERTFGLAFAASPGGHAEMMRTWILEDATPHVDPNQVAIPADWPFWDQRHDLATQSVLPGDDTEDDDTEDYGGGSTALLTRVAAPRKTLSADEKILKALDDLSDPLGIDAVYAHKDQIGAIAGLEGSTLDNALSRLVKAGRIHREVRDGREVRGMYGPGTGPQN